MGKDAADAVSGMLLIDLRQSTNVLLASVLCAYMQAATLCSKAAHAAYLCVHNRVRAERTLVV